MARPCGRFAHFMDFSSFEPGASGGGVPDARRGRARVARRHFPCSFRRPNERPEVSPLLEHGLRFAAPRAGQVATHRAVVGVGAVILANGSCLRREASERGRRSLRLVGGRRGEGRLPVRVMLAPAGAALRRLPWVGVGVNMESGPLRPQGKAAATNVAGASHQPCRGGNKGGPLRPSRSKERLSIRGGRHRGALLARVCGGRGRGLRQGRRTAIAGSQCWHVMKRRAERRGAPASSARVCAEGDGLVRESAPELDHECVQRLVQGCSSIDCALGAWVAIGDRRFGRRRRAGERAGRLGGGCRACLATRARTDRRRGLHRARGRRAAHAGHGPSMLLARRHDAGSARPHGAPPEELTLGGGRRDSDVEPTRPSLRAWQRKQIHACTSEGMYVFRHVCLHKDAH